MAITLTKPRLSRVLFLLPPLSSPSPARQSVGDTDWWHHEQPVHSASKITAKLVVLYITPPVSFSRLSFWRSPALPPLSLPHTLTHTHRLSLSPSFLRTAADMVDAFVGTWLLKESDKFDDYMKELGKCSVYFYFFLLLFFFNACTLRRGVCAHACETEDAAVVPVLQASACWDGFEASWMV